MNPAAAEESVALSYDDAKKLVSWAKDEYSKAKSARVQTQLQWYLNMAFYRGEQHVEVYPRHMKLQTPPAPPYRVRHVANRIRPLVRIELARLTSQKPNASVVPASSEDEDLFAAQAGEQVWESVYARKRIHEVFTDAAFWMEMTGVGFIKTYWDNVAYDNDAEAEGDICFGSVTPFHLFVPDLRERTLDQQPYVLNVYTKPVDWVRHFWKAQLENNDVVPSTVSANELLEDVYLGIKGASSNLNTPDACLVTEVWVKPGGHKNMPNGGLLTIVDNQIVQFSPDGLPYAHGNYPFAKIEHTPTGKFYAESPIVDVIPLQREYNRTRSQIIESKNRMAKPQLLAAMGSIDPTKITTEPGQVILYRAGMPPPQPLPLQDLPAYVINDLQAVLMDFEDITGQHQVSKGNTPPGVTAATAISYLQEKDDSYLTYTYQSVERAWETIAHQTLTLAVQYWDVNRTVKVVGTDGAFDTMLLKGSDLSKGTDIRMEGGSALPVSKAARQALLQDLAAQGAVEWEEALKLMDLGGLQKLYQKLQTDEREAQRENVKMKRLMDEDVTAHAEQFTMLQEQGDPMTMSTPAMGEMPMPLEVPPVIPINTWNNHEVHIEIHNRFRKSQAFELLSEPVKMQFEQHVNLHQAALAEIAMAMGMGPGMEEEMPGEEPPPEEESQEALPGM